MRISTVFRFPALVPAIVLTAALIVSVSVAPAASAAKVNIGVAPSANGYVMQGQPTQIAVTGAKRAKIFLKRDGKWRLLGTARKNRALPYTFRSAGVQSVRVKPRKGKARIFGVPVYDRTATSRPGALGGQIFTRFPSTLFRTSTSASISADSGCVLLDIGAKNSTVEVLSTGAPPWQGSAMPGAEIAQMGIPVAGDIVLSWNQNVSGERWAGGYNAICLNPRL